MTLPRRVAGALMVLYLALVAWIVFLPTAAVASGSVTVIAALLQAAGFPPQITPTTVEFATNVLLFVPASFLGRSFRPHWGWKQWLLVGLAGTLFIEAVQHLLLPGRSAQLMDIIANTLGAVVGYLLVVQAGRMSGDRVTQRDRGR